MFVADLMLKKLARWLRILGVDTVYPDVIEDNDILKLAKKEGRVLLTQDVELASRAGKYGVRACLVPRDDIFEKQIASVFKEFHLELDFPEKTRCPQCNSSLEIVGKTEIKGNSNVPEKVFEKQSKFWLCCNCGKVYWEGSHWEKIEKSVKKINQLINPTSVISA